MKSEDFKKLVAVSGGIKFIENNIHGKKEYVENPDYERRTAEGKYASRYIEKFIPYTKSYLFSHWMIGLQWKGSDGCLCYAWFYPLRSEDGSFSWYLDHIWKPGPGRKMRRDARWNLEMKMMKKAKIY